MDAFRVIFTNQEDNGRGVGRRVVRQTLNPVFINTTAFCNGINIRLQRQCDHIRPNAVNYGGRLLTRTAMRLTNHDIIAGFLFVVRTERFVVLFVQFTCWIVGNI